MSSANIEFSLITRIIDDGDFHSVEKAGVDEDFLSSPQVIEAFRFLSNTFHNQATFGMVPSRDMFLQYFPRFPFYTAPDPVPVICEFLRTEKTRLDVEDLLDEVRELNQRDPKAAVARLYTDTLNLRGRERVGEELSMSGAFQQLHDRYQMMQNSQGLVGVPYPWYPLNEVTQGMQEGQFIIIYGRPKSMKTWVAVEMARDAYIRSRRRVLFYTREMAPIQIAQRVAAQIARVDYAAFKAGRLQPSLQRRVFEILQYLRDDEIAAGAYGLHQPYFKIITDKSQAAGGSGGGIGWLQAKIRDLRPDIVFVDGMYLMKDDRTNQRTVDWKQVAHISQDLKGTAQDFGIPIVGVTQANRSAEKTKGVDLTELAFADAFGMDADAVYRIIKTKNKETKLTELMITAPGGRDFELDGIVIHGQPGVNFSYIRSLQGLDEEAPEEYSNPATGDQGQRRRGPHRDAPRSFVDPKVSFNFRR